MSIPAAAATTTTSKRWSGADKRRQGLPEQDQPYHLLSTAAALQGGLHGGRVLWWGCAGHSGKNGNEPRQQKLHQVEPGEYRPPAAGFLPPGPHRGGATHADGVQHVQLLR
uniref:(northern house mosquito) hypothetical protein n=1 Tax=Culex pipiens TaxID=7175 RepID=A0A8D8FBS7_CULPI